MNSIERIILNKQQNCIHPPQKIRATGNGKIVCDGCGMEEEN